MLAEEDRGPSWLRDYGYTDFGNIEADIQAMEEFAKRLRSDLEANYVPHLSSVTDAMLTRLPPPAATFPELVAFMRDHQAAQDTTQTNVYNFANGTNRFATAAQTISKRTPTRSMRIQRAFDSWAPRELKPRRPGRVISSGIFFGSTFDPSGTTRFRNRVASCVMAACSGTPGFSRAIGKTHQSRSFSPRGAPSFPRGRNAARIARGA